MNKVGPTMNKKCHINSGEVGLLRKEVILRSQEEDLSWKFKLPDKIKSVMVNGSYEDGPEDTIMYPKIEDQAVIAGIGKIYHIRQTKNSSYT